MGVMIWWLLSDVESLDGYDGVERGNINATRKLSVDLDGILRLGFVVEKRIGDEDVRE